MNKEELIKLAEKVREGKATDEERKAFFSEFKGVVDDLNSYVKSLASKDSDN